MVLWDHSLSIPTIQLNFKDLSLGTCWPRSTIGYLLRSRSGIRLCCGLGYYDRNRKFSRFGLRKVNCSPLWDVLWRGSGGELFQEELAALVLVPEMSQIIQNILDWGPCIGHGWNGLGIGLEQYILGMIQNDLQVRVESSSRKSSPPGRIKREVISGEQFTFRGKVGRDWVESSSRKSSPPQLQNSKTNRSPPPQTWIARRPSSQYQSYIARRLRC